MSSKEEQLRSACEHGDLNKARSTVMQDKTVLNSKDMVRYLILDYDIKYCL